MKFRGLILAVIVLCALGGALYWSKGHKPAAEDLASTKSPVILSVNQADVTGLTVKKKDSPLIELAKSAGGSWKITQPQALNANADTVSDMLSALSPLNAERVIETAPGNLARYGLEQPALEIGIVGKNGKTQQLEIGDSTPTGAAVYARLAGKPDIYTTPSFNESSLDKGLNDLRDTRLVPVDVEKVTRLDYRKGKENIVFGHGKESWQIEKPQPMRANSEAVDDLAQQVAQARMDLSGVSSSGAGAEKEFARAQPFVTIQVTDDQGEQTLEVRKTGKGAATYYAKSSMTPGIYKIDSSVGDALNKSLADFRNKALFDFSYRQPEKIQVQDGSKAWLLTYSDSGNDWWSNGRKMDADSVSTLVSDLRDLTATGFATSGFGKPEITLSVTSKKAGGGELNEQVQIAKTDKSYIAKRENEPALYALSSSDVEGLLSAAGGIQASKGKK